MHDSAEFDLARLLGAVERETFFRDTWEKQPLAVARDNPAYYQSLFSRRDLDSVLAFTRPQFRDPASYKPGDSSHSNIVQAWLPEDEAFAGCYPGLPEVHRAFARGKTLLINSMQHRWPAIAAMSRNLEVQFGCPVHTYLLLTPPGAQGLAAHYDAYEIFVLQIDGVKHWRFYGCAREMPLPSDQNEIPRDQLGPPTQEVFLKPGDLLYMPRGHVHEAFTSDRASLHLTVGIRIYRWLDLLRNAFAGAAAADVRFRQSPPPGLLCAGTFPRESREKFKELLELLARDANLDDSLAAMTETFVGGLPAFPADYFAIDDPDRINLDTTLERAPGVFFRIVEKGEGVTLHAPGARIEGPSKIASAAPFRRAGRGGSRRGRYRTT